MKTLLYKIEIRFEVSVILHLHQDFVSMQSCNHTSNTLKRSTYIIIIPLISCVLFFLLLRLSFSAQFVPFSLSLSLNFLLFSLSSPLRSLSYIRITLKILLIRYGNQKALEHIQRRLTLLFLWLRVRTHCQTESFVLQRVYIRSPVRRSWRVISTSSFTIYSSISS